MVDARLPSEWLGSIRIDNLSDRAFRVLAGALMWCNGQGTDGSIPLRYSKYLHPDGDDEAAFEELEQAGLWQRDGEGFTLIGWSVDLRQSTAEEVQRYREASRRRQKAYRDRRRGIDVAGTSDVSRASSVSRDVTHNGSRDVTADVGSGSLRASDSTSAYVQRDVTHNADSPFCRKHPAGTAEPCGACARARTALAARQSTIPGLGWDCAVDGHKLVVDGTCAVCTHRPSAAGQVT